MIRCTDCKHCVVVDNYLMCEAYDGEVSCYVAHGDDVCRENAEIFGGDNYIEEFMDIICYRGVPDCLECMYSLGKDKDNPEIGETCQFVSECKCKDMFMGEMCLHESRPFDRLDWNWS